jgi:glutathione S-transferase
MKLYFSKGACSLAVRILINELGIRSEFEAVDLKTKKTADGEDYLQINPKGAVPMIVTDDGHKLTENAVILQYLADVNKATQLLPMVGDFKRYEVLEWVNYITTELHKPFALLFRPLFSAEIKDSVIKPVIKQKLEFVNKELGSKTYLMGDDFTLPDCYLFVILTWSISMKMALTEYPNLVRYFDNLHKRNSVRKSLEQEGLEFAVQM